MSLLTAFKPRTESATNTRERDVIIRLDNITVRYDVPQERIHSLKEYVIRRAQRRISHHEFCALRDLNLEVRQGETLGIVGRNGAGKSTLLKVIARVIRPTTGRVRTLGRVAPLLELGAGFHPELTGRENVLLNGTLLGHPRWEIEEQFERIVDFAELWEFIDAPLRTYSTGMIARLGFAVATAWVPDILILDEVLSVGDAEFQLKSSERIQRIRGEGATVLLVSHSAESVQAACDRAIWLDHGRVVAEGSADAVARQYRGDAMAVESKRLAQASEPVVPTQRWGSRLVEIVGVRLTNGKGKDQNLFETGDPLVLHIDYVAHEAVRSPIFGVAIYRQDGLHISGPNTSFAGLTLPTLEGAGTITYTVPYLPLLEGLYEFSVAAVNRDDTEIYDYHDRLYPFRVVNEKGKMREHYGLMTLRGEWKNEVSRK